MVELSIRLLAASTAVLLAGWLGRPEFDVAWKVGALVVVYATLIYRIDRKGLLNPGFAGFAAVADAFAIAFLVGSAGLLESMGFLVLAPCAYAAARYGSLPTGMAPLAASAVLCAHATLGTGQGTDLKVLVQAGAVMLVGLLLNHRRIVMTVTRDVPVAAEFPHRGPEPEGFMELRENFRKLRDAYKDLERRSRRDRLVAQLQDARLAKGDRFLPRLAARVQELTGAQSVGLYSVAQYADSLVVRAVCGDMPEAMRTEGFDVEATLAPGQIRHAVGKLLDTVLSDADRSRVEHVLLTDGGAVSGMLVVRHERADHLSEARERAEELAPFAAALIREHDDRASHDRRLRETEVLYETAVVSAGSETPIGLCGRVVRHAAELLEVDHFGVFLVEGHDAMPMTHSGVPLRLLEEMKFEEGQGVRGWLAAGAPVLALHDAGRDVRLDPTLALKKRIHSFCLVPLQYGEKPCGFLTAAAHRVGGVDVSDLSTLRAIAAELSMALGRVIEGSSGPEGMVTPAEFHQSVASSKGALVMFETLQHDALCERFGTPGVEHALRAFVRKLRGRLPNGAALCRREAGTFAVFLPGATASFAESWANEATAHASLIPLKTPDGLEVVPLAVRAKAAQIAPQLDGVVGAGSLSQVQV